MYFDPKRPMEMVIKNPRGHAKLQQKFGRIKFNQGLLVKRPPLKADFAAKWKKFRLNFHMVNLLLR